MASVRKSKDVPVWRGFPQEGREGPLVAVVVVVVVVEGGSLVPQARLGI